MAVHDFRAQRLFVETGLAHGTDISCTREQAHYLVNVLRLQVGDQIRVFNGRDGEWLCELAAVGKKSCTLVAEEQTRQQTAGPDITYYFAPLKRARLDFVVQKATELGVARIAPIFTQRTSVERVNLDRMRANVIEAAEQCGILRLPEVLQPQKLSQMLDGYPMERCLVVCDEAAPVASPVTALANLKGIGCDVLLGPEGGFSDAERAQLLGNKRVCPISLGPRIMRADTAAVAVLALMNGVIGDWQDTQQ